MGHSRVKMELIKKESTRMLTYQKRKKSLVKKVSEFSILCGVQACLIIFGPKDKDRPVNKLDTVWPSNNSDEAKTIINKFKKTDQARRCYYVSDYFSDKKKKVDVEISKLQKQVYGAKYPSWDVRLDNFSQDQLRLLLTRLESKLQVSDQKLTSIQENQNNPIEMFLPKVVCNSHNMENYATKSDNFQVFPDLMKSSEGQFPVCSFPGQNSYLLPLNSNFMPSDSNNLCSTSLRLFSDYHSTMAGKSLMDMSRDNSSSNNLQLQLFSAKPLDVQLPLHFQPQQSFQGIPLNHNLMEAAIMEMSNNQNFSNLFGLRGISNTPSLPGVSYVNPQFLMPENLMLHNVDACTPLQLMLPVSRIQLPTSSLSNQVCPSQVDKFSYDIGFQKQEFDK